MTLRDLAYAKDLALQSIEMACFTGIRHIDGYSGNQNTSQSFTHPSPT